MSNPTPVNLPEALLRRMKTSAGVGKIRQVFGERLWTVETDEQPSRDGEGVETLWLQPQETNATFIAMDHKGFFKVSLKRENEFHPEVTDMDIELLRWIDENFGEDINQLTVMYKFKVNKNRVYVFVTDYIAEGDNK